MGTPFRLCAYSWFFVWETKRLAFVLTCTNSQETISFTIWYTYMENWKPPITTRKCSQTAVRKIVGWLGKQLVEALDGSIDFGLSITQTLWGCTRLKRRYRTPLFYSMKQDFYIRKNWIFIAWDLPCFSFDQVRFQLLTFSLVMASIPVNVAPQVQGNSPQWWELTSKTYSFYYIFNYIYIYEEPWLSQVRCNNLCIFRFKISTDYSSEQFQAVTVSENSTKIVSLGASMLPEF